MIGLYIATLDQRHRETYLGHAGKPLNCAKSLRLRYCTNHSAVYDADGAALDCDKSEGAGLMQRECFNGSQSVDMTG